MLNTLEKQQLVSPVNEIISDIILKKSHFRLAYEKWLGDYVDQNIFSMEQDDIPVNSKLNNQSNLLDVIYNEILNYKEFLSLYLDKHSKTLIYSHCVDVIKKDCDNFKERLHLSE